jgi:hypothetical protein
MDARRLRLDAGGGPLVAIQSSVAGAEEPEPLAMVLRQPPARRWPTTAEIVVPMGPFNRRVTTRRRTPARVWVFALAMVGAAFVAFMLVGIAQRGNPPAFDRIEQQLQSIEETALPSKPLSAAARPIEPPIGEWAGLAAVPIEPSRLVSPIGRMPALVQAPGNDAGGKARSSAAGPTTGRNAGTKVLFPASDPPLADGPALAKASAQVLAEAGGAQRIDAAALIARGDEFLRHSDVTSARLFYKLAAANGSAAGAIAMGSTYDPIFLERNAVRGVKPEPGRALAWYRAAAELGDATGKARSVQLLEALRRDAARGDPQAKAILEGPIP